VEKSQHIFKTVFLVAVLLMVVGYSFFWLKYTDLGNQWAAVFLSHNPKTVAQLQTRYAAVAATRAPVRVLLVPGHEPNYGGSEYAGLKERELNVELAGYLKELLSRNSRYAVVMTRDNNAWEPEFADYFQQQWEAIKEWQRASHEESSHLIATGAMETPQPSAVYHNKAPKDVALRLYGITKWANEHDIDIEIHLHFNDEPAHRANKPGQYAGFAIYVPSAQYQNSATTKAIAASIFRRLSINNPVSNLPGESTGIIDEPELIAVGTNNTADAASLLIEYSYIYEPHIVSDMSRSLVLRDLALQTYLGLEDFFAKL
jgi:N-acetylmuramoyl-L-alanine amidase